MGSSFEFAQIKLSNTLLNFWLGAGLLQPSWLTFPMKALGVSAGDLLHVALCWAEGDTTG